MKDSCIFCGISLGRFQRKKLSCGYTTQILCEDCYERYASLSAEERAEAALQTGRAEEPGEIQEYLDNIRRGRQKRADEEKTKVEKKVTDKVCLRCQGKMLDCGPVTFKLGEESFFFSDWNRLMSGSLTMQLLRCEQCGKVEFYIGNDEALEQLGNHQ